MATASKKIQTRESAEEHYADKIIAACSDVKSEMSTYHGHVHRAYVFIENECPALIKSASASEPYQLLDTDARSELDELMDYFAQTNTSGSYVIESIKQCIGEIFDAGKVCSYVASYEAAEKKYLKKIEDLQNEIKTLKDK